MKLEEAKELFKKYHPEEADYIKKRKYILESLKHDPQLRIDAMCVWYGFRYALKITEQLKEKK
ncbi:MAG: hypothetical protein AABY22_12055 [Nanoarchaeota archaeon]